jgi:hypothetical protein
MHVGAAQQCLTSTEITTKQEPSEIRQSKRLTACTNNTPLHLLQVMHIIRQHLAPATLWQEACLPPACHRDILPTQLHCLAGFDTMMKHTMLNCDVRGGELLRSRMSTDQLARSVLLPPPGAAPSSAVQELTSVLSGFFAALIGGS